MSSKKLSSSDREIRATNNILAILQEIELLIGLGPELSAAQKKKITKRLQDILKNHLQNG